MQTESKYFTIFACPFLLFCLYFMYVKSSTARPVIFLTCLIFLIISLQLIARRLLAIVVLCGMLFHYLLEEFVGDYHAAILWTLLLLPVVALGWLFGAAGQIEERVVKWRSKWMVTLTICLATSLMVLRVALMLVVVVLLGVLLLVVVMVAAKGLLWPVSRRFRRLIYHYNTCISTPLVKAQVWTGSITRCLHSQFLGLTELTKVFGAAAVSFLNVVVLVTRLGLIVRLVHLLMAALWVSTRIPNEVLAVPPMERYLFTGRGLVAGDVELRLASLLIWTRGESWLASIHLLHAQLESFWGREGAFSRVCHTFESKGYQGVLSHDLVIIEDGVFLWDIERFEERGHQLPLQHIRRIVGRGSVIIGGCAGGGFTIEASGGLILWIWTDWAGCCMGVGLYSLLEGPHLLYLNQLATPLLIDGISLISFQSEFLGQSALNLSQLIHLFLELLDFFICLLCLLTLESVDCFE